MENRPETLETPNNKEVIALLLKKRTRLHKYIKELRSQLRVAMNIIRCGKDSDCLTLAEGMKKTP